MPHQAIRPAILRPVAIRQATHAQCLQNKALHPVRVKIQAVQKNQANAQKRFSFGKECGILDMQKESNICGCRLAVWRQLPKLIPASSTLVTRSTQSSQRPKAVGCFRMHFPACSSLLALPCCRSRLAALHPCLLQAFLRTHNPCPPGPTHLFPSCGHPPAIALIQAHAKSAGLSVCPQATPPARRQQRLP